MGAIGELFKRRGRYKALKEAARREEIHKNRPRPPKWAHPHIKFNDIQDEDRRDLANFIINMPGVYGELCAINKKKATEKEAIELLKTIPMPQLCKQVKKAVTLVMRGGKWPAYIDDYLTPFFEYLKKMQS